MTTNLEGELRREITIGKTIYTLTLSPTGFKLVVKGRRKGLEIKWADLVSGDAALAAALNASVAANIAPAKPPTRPVKRARSSRAASR